LPTAVLARTTTGRAAGSWPAARRFPEGAHRSLERLPVRDQRIETEAEAAGAIDCRFPHGGDGNGWAALLHRLGVDLGLRYLVEAAGEAHRVGSPGCAHRPDKLLKARAAPGHRHVRRGELFRRISLAQPGNHAPVAQVVKRRARIAGT
jgi:hypothetical protein